MASTAPPAAAQVRYRVPDVKSGRSIAANDAPGSVRMNGVVMALGWRRGDGLRHVTCETSVHSVIVRRLALNRVFNESHESALSTAGNDLTELIRTIRSGDSDVENVRLRDG